MTRSGFTTIELIIVVIMLGVIATIGFPRIRDAVEKQNRRSMRAALVTYVATARGLAVARGCRSSLHFTAGSGSKVWVTTCAINGAGRDTVIRPVATEAQWGHRLLAGRDSIDYTARGLRQSFERTVIKIRTKGDLDRDSVVVNELGKVVYP